MTVKTNQTIRTFYYCIPLFLFLLAGHLPLLAQTTTEDCTNGIDDDGDGLIDCYDQDCTCTGQCEDFYYTTCNADCFYIPPCGQLSLGIQWVAQAETHTYSPLVAGDLDADGIPEIVTYRCEGPEMYIIDGATGATKVTIIVPTDLPGGTCPAIADLDHDGFGEIVIIGNDRYLRCYEHDGTLKYTSAIQVGYDSRYRFSVPNIADFDHDGWAEVNVGNQVYNGQTGALLAQGGPGVSAGEHPARVANGFSFNMPVVMDVLPDNFCPDCDGLEIVAGNQVLSVNLNTGAVNVVVSAPANYSDGFTSVADIDGDGDLDAVVQGKRGTFNTVYAWEIETPTVIRQYQLLNNWVEGASRVNIADLNGDGKLEISFVSYPRLYALRNNFTLMWSVPTNDASAITCSSVFDFCGDGSADVVYRGQSFLQILDGTTGQVAWQDVCASLTHIENPLILDVDADGQTEIVIECGYNGNGNAGTVVAYEAVGLPGIASRRVWNQHAYFNTNINDDLSVPRYQQNPHIVGDSLKMNTFLNQYFNPTFPSPDARLTLQNIQCLGDSLEITARVCNTGDNLLPQQTPLSAYLGNPTTTNAPWLGTAPIGQNVLPDSCYTFTFKIPRLTPDSIFVVMNDDHSEPAPFNLAQDFPVTAIGECSFTDNMVGTIFPYDPKQITLGQDTAICDNTSLAFDVSGNDLISWQWWDNNTANQRTLPAPGTYSVTVTDVCGITQTDAIVLSVDSSTVVGLGPDLETCAGEAVSLAESGFDFYQWGPATSVNCANCPAVDALPATSGMVMLTAGFSNGCVNRDTVFITVRDTFFRQIDTMICYGIQLDWLGSQIPPNEQKTFFLQTVHGCDSTVLVRAIGTTTGTFQVQVDTSVCLGKQLDFIGSSLSAGDDKTFFLSAVTGCDSTVHVSVAPRDTFSTAENRILCDGESTVIFGQTVTSSGVFRQKFTAQNGCDSTHTVDLLVRAPLVLSMTTDPSCFGEATGLISVAVSNNAPPYQYAWSFTNINTNEVSDVPAGSYSVTVTNIFSCTKTAQGTVAAYPPIVFAAESDSVRCFGEANGAIQLNTPDTSLVFSLDNQQYAQQLAWPGLIAGNYEVYAQDIYGCVDTLPIQVLQPPPVVLDMPPSTKVSLGDSLILDMFVAGLPPLNYQWNTSQYLSCADCPKPVIKPLDHIWYKLVLSDANGCSASDSMQIEVARIIGYFIPNIFRPTDGAAENSYNESLQPSFGPAIRLIRAFRIYDRWGDLQFEKRNAFPGDKELVWDGRSRGGRTAPAGVYAWMIELELVDGYVVRYTGDVTVVR